MLYTSAVLVAFLSVCFGAEYEVVVRSTEFRGREDCLSAVGKDPYAIPGDWPIDAKAYYCLVNLDHETEPSDLSLIKLEFWNPDNDVARRREVPNPWSIKNKGYEGGPQHGYPLESLYRLYDSVDSGADGLYTLIVKDGSDAELCSTTFTIGRPTTMVLNIALRSSNPSSFSDCDASDVDSGMPVRFVDSGNGNPGSAYYESVWICAQYRWNLPQGTDILQIGELDGSNFNLIDETSKAVTTVRKEDILVLELSIDDVNNIVNGDENVPATIRAIGEIDNSFISDAVDMNEFDFNVVYIANPTPGVVGGPSPSPEPEPCSCTRKVSEGWSQVFEAYCNGKETEEDCTKEQMCECA